MQAAVAEEDFDAALSDAEQMEVPHQQLIDFIEERRAAMEAPTAHQKHRARTADAPHFRTGHFMRHKRCSQQASLSVPGHAYITAVL